MLPGSNIEQISNASVMFSFIQYYQNKQWKMFTLAKASVKYVVIGDCILCAHPYALSILYFEKTRQHFYVIELGFRL